MCISYRHGLSGVAYPLRWQCESQKGGISRYRFPRLLVCIYLKKHTAEFGNLSAKLNTLMIHIGTQIRLKMEERQKTVVWLAEQLSCSRTNVYKIFDKYSVDTKQLTKISTILNFDFFSLYSETVKINNNENKL